MMADNDPGSQLAWRLVRAAWLRDVLSERFGISLLIDVSARHFRIGVEGSEYSISFNRDLASFCRPSSDFPCSSWDAASEGWISPLQRPLPAPGADELQSPVIERIEAGYRIGYDILGLVCWVLSRQEEVGRNDLDAHGRFPATASHAYLHGYLERPIVDEWLAILGQVIQRLWPDLPIRIPEFSMRVSHDVDAPSRYAFSTVPQLLRIMVGDAVKRRSPLGALKAPWIRANSTSQLNSADPTNTFDWIMDVSERHYLTSAFYFICGRTDASKDARYDVEDPRIRALMRRIHERGHEIGLHPSYETYREPGAIAVEADRLRRVCREEGIEQSAWGGRMHYLRWQTPTTLYGWEAAGMAYDTTLSYADRPGFRCGTCFEYPAFDPVAGKRMALRIRPLIAMECTIMADRYLGLGKGDEALARFIQLKDACKAVGGIFTTLFHNTVFEDSETRVLYEALLAA